MVFNNYKIKFLVRVIMLSIFILALVYSVLILNNIIRSIFSLALCIFSIVELLNYLNKTNRDFQTFINALYYEDFTNYYSNPKKQDSEIYGLFNKLNDKYRKIAYEKEVQHALLQTIIRHINIGVLVMQNDQVILSNKSFSRLLGVNVIGSLQDIENRSDKLAKELCNINSGKSDLIELVLNGEIFKLSISSSNFKLDGILYKLISVQDINTEMDEQEIVSWQKLIRVLTHEIMNSVTPISSLTSSLNNLLTKAIDQQSIESKHLKYLSDGLNTIQDRSEGLIKFTEAYKKLTKLKNPEFEQVNVSKLLESIVLLHKAKLEALDISMIIDVKEDEVITADKLMLEQVLINLMQNSIQAFDNIRDRQIQLKCFKLNNYTNIQIVDNGIGIPEDKIDKIFIPFFTTKKSGSGIGLSFARQVIQLHKGNISVKSVPGETIITLKF